MTGVQTCALPILEIHAYIRGVKKFANLEEVKKQVDKDIEAVRVYMDGVIYNMKK